MRTGYKFDLAEHKNDLNVKLNLDIDQIERKREYSRLSSGINERKKFIEALCSEPWIQELNESLKNMISKSNSVLSIGSGLGEHEVLLHQEGFNITASDIVTDGLESTKKLFPDLKIMRFDILNPDYSVKYDCALVTGLLFYFDYPEAQNVFFNCNKLLKAGGKLIFVLRYRDNLFTRFIDNFLVPLEIRLKNTILAAKKSGRRYIRKKGGQRRSVSEILELGNAAGFRMRRISHAGFGVEATRSAVLLNIPFLKDVLSRVDRKLHVLNNAVVFAFEKMREIDD